MIPQPTEEYLEKALDAEERARNSVDSELRARWLGIAFGYRELARFRQQSGDKISLVPEQPPAISQVGKVS
jgi:hypothetical protein